jgi:uncharacterized membrane protein
MGGGVLFGMFSFGTYSLVNLAVLRDWSPLVALVDIIEGGLITGIACTAAYFLSQVIV